MAIATINIDPTPGEAPLPSASGMEMPPADEKAFAALPKAVQDKWITRWSTPGGPPIPSYLKGVRGRVAYDPATETASLGGPITPEAKRTSTAAPSGRTRTITLDPPTPAGGAVSPSAPLTSAQMIQQYEGGGLQAPTIDPIDLATFGVAGLGEGLAKSGINTGLREAAALATSFPLAERAQHLAEPYIEKIPGAGPVGQVVRGTLRQTAGMAPFVAAGALPATTTAAIRAARGQAEVEAAAKTAAEKVATETTERATEGQESVLDKAASADKQSAKAVASFQQQQMREAEPEATKEVIGQTLPPPSGRMLMEQGPERTQRGVDFRENLKAGPRRWRAGWRTRRDAIIGEAGDREVSGSALRQELAEEAKDYAPGSAPYGARAQHLLTKIERLYKTPPEQITAETSEVVSTPQGYTIKPAKAWTEVAGQIAGWTPERKEEFLANLEKRNGPQARQAVEQALTSAGVVLREPKVNELRSIQAEAKELERTSGGADKTLASRIVHGVDRSLTEELDIPALKEINKEYREHRSHFPFPLEKAIEEAPNPTAAARIIFADPERVLDLKKFGTPEENGYLNQLYADYVDKEGVKALDPTVVKALGLPGPLSKPEAFVFADKTAKRLDGMMETAPRTKAKVLARVSKEAQAINNEEAIPVVKEGIRRLRRLGQPGQRIIAQIDAAQTPYEKSQVVVRAFTGLPIEQLAQESGEAAGVKAIQEFVPKDSGWRGTLKRYAQRAGTIGIPMAMFGRPYFLEAGLVAGASVLPQELFRRAWLNSLKNPEVALAVYHAMQSPGTEASMKVLSRAIVNSMAPAAAQIEPAVVPKAVNPVVKSAESKRHAGIAGPHATADKIGDVASLSKKVTAPGKPTDVHRDLSSGRVSLGHVRKMLDAGSGTDLASTFQGLSPADTIDVLAKASPSERETFFPAVVQKLNDSRNQMSPQQSQMLMAQLQRMMSAPEATA